MDSKQYISNDLLNKHKREYIHSFIEKVGEQYEGGINSYILFRGTKEDVKTKLNKFIEEMDVSLFAIKKIQAWYLNEK